MNLDRSLNDLKCKVNALDEMFDCPVCFERLSGNVFQCMQGHHLCRKCRSLVTQCPVCKRCFTGTRNYFVENMITKFEEMKCSLIKLSASSNVPVANQNKKETMVVQKEKFPCGLDTCYKSLSFHDLLNHIKKDHKYNFTNVGSIMFKKYTHSWYIPYDPNSAWDEILYIYDIGIFFIKIDISHRGNVYGHVEVVNSPSFTRHFDYELEMGNDEYVNVFSGQVESTRSTHKKGKYARIDDLLWTTVDGDLFTCTLTLKYVS